MMRALEAIEVPDWTSRLPKVDLHCHAEAYARLDQVLARSEQRIAACIEAARDGPHGIDFLPYAGVREADYTAIARWAHRAAEAGLGVTIHAGEFSVDGLEPAVRLPGLARIGHGVFVPDRPRVLEDLAARGIVVECCLTSNVVLGAVATYAIHPIREVVARGVPVTLATDNPAKLWTSIGREYAIAAAMGFSEAELRTFTRNGIASSFLAPDEKQELLAAVTPPQ